MDVQPSQAGTHSGSFHADDVMGGAILDLVFPAIEIVRTRDLQRLQHLPIVFDVGGEYAPERGRFDHHQKGGAGARESGIPYASSGLLWKQFGLEAARNIAEVGGVDFAELVTRVDRLLMAPIDAHDCGVSQPTTGMLSFPKALTLLNDPPGASPARIDETYGTAKDIAGEFLRKVLIHEAVVMKTATSILDYYSGGAILELPANFLWEEAVISSFPDVRFVISPKAEQFNIKTVPLEVDSFQHRQLLPAAWAGLQNDSLAAVCGVSDAIFCHNGRFVAGTASIEGARALAAQALLRSEPEIR